MNLACSCFEIVLLAVLGRSLVSVFILLLCGKALQTVESHERRKIVNQAPSDGGNNPKQSPHLIAAIRLHLAFRRGIAKVGGRRRRVRRSRGGQGEISLAR